jgi:hypothetical protein
MRQDDEYQQLDWEEQEEQPSELESDDNDGGEVYQSSDESGGKFIFLDDILSTLDPPL